MSKRYRCTNCGNVTRFDVTSTVTKREFYHYTVGGELTIEGTDVIAVEDVVVSCRWCESAKNVIEFADGDETGNNETVAS